MNKNTKLQIDKLIKKLSALIESAPDDQIIDLLGDGIIGVLLKSIAKPKSNTKQLIYDYLLDNKQRLTILALIKLAIQNNYSFKGKVNNVVDVFVSPLHYQWFENGVMFTQGEKPFGGLIGLYQDKKLKFAVASRDIKPNEKLGPNDFLFIDVDKVGNKFKKQLSPKNFKDLDNALQLIESYLRSRNESEKIYQEFFQKFSWFFGAQYSQIDSHKSLDDENIPDFTGIRVKDKTRDVIEIKQPFLKIFNKKNNFNASFNNAWNQIERYLDFIKTHDDYCYKQKGLRFDNPTCYLICGYNLNEVQLKQIRRKERSHPEIRILTYNDVLTMAKGTIKFFKTLGKHEKKKK